MKILVGNTGLVGTTLKNEIKFDLEFNSNNISSFIDDVPNNCDIYLTCLPATKWLVNKNIIGDIDNIYNLIKILSNKTYNNIILVSTIDVYNESPLKSNEDYIPNFSKLNYGNNRYLFELLVKEYLEFKKLSIFRLPALFSKDIKKNVLYDLINDNNVESININSKYQWYNLQNLVNDINSFQIKHPENEVFNLFTEPIDTIDIVKLFPNINIDNLYKGGPIIYDYTTKFGIYILNKETVINEIKTFVNEISVK
jgi:hypothetical protein